ncbi:MAG: DUF4321 domain-containing protein [Firmicutes bacterium]|nr:DUF4321 domain-containing protein [Bacillota bacterium]MBQ9603984.1 DUF4321 domain-containing protein [Bacillota bacterium]
MQKGNIVFFLTLISGLIIGGFIGDVLGRVPALSWLNYGKEIGLTSPFFLDLSFMSLTFGLTLKLTLAGIIGMVIAIILYKKL